MFIPQRDVTDGQARFLMFFGALLCLPIGIALAASGQPKIIGVGAGFGAAGVLFLVLWWKFRADVPDGEPATLQRLGAALSVGCAALTVLALVLFLRTSPGDPISELAPSIASGAAALLCLAVRIWTGLRLRALLRRKPGRSRASGSARSRSGQRSRSRRRPGSGRRDAGRRAGTNGR